ncbi:MAG TPA: phosphoglucosamine mutase [Steroidobacteraceae bacterium]|nr:phosphoglucosamine mutase [Steroidobacteraceae bacterium]
MSREYFGTDGIRGKVGEHPMTVDFALNLASAAAQVLAPEGGRVLIGKDTRLSGYLFESALEAGFVAAGVDVLLSGPLPTPAVAYLTRRFQCHFGVVISASHNPYDDNGIKFFDSSGGKLSDELEEQIEARMQHGPITRASRSLGRATREERSRTQYQEFCAATLPPGVNLEGLKIVIDCANGAAYKVGPRLLADLGAEIVPVGCSPNGRNINDGCGSTAPGLLQLTVPGVRADLGLALDGDGDRLIMVDHLGRVVDGDQLLYVMARARAREGRLTGPVVGTVMSNFGLEQALAAEGIEFRRAPVGDRYVLALLRETGGVLGGEASGHILCLDQTTTGDALVCALEVLAVMKRSGRALAELAAGMEKFPQVLLNVRVAQRFDPGSVAQIQDTVRSIEQRLAGAGRVVLRASGTEPVIRVMVEGRDEKATRSAAAELAEAVRAVATGSDGVGMSHA